MTEEQEFVGSPFDLVRLHGRFEVVDAQLLIETFPWWTRALAWCLWHTPVRRLVPRRFASPYTLVRAKLRPVLSYGSEIEGRIRAQAASELSQGDSSGSGPVPT